MIQFNLFESDNYNPYFNLALEQCLFELHKKGEATLLLWQNDKTVVIGRYQNAYEEVNLDFAEKNNVIIVRRDTGGGAVFHDLGNLNYSFIVDEETGIDTCNMLVDAVLVSLGFVPERKGRNDIYVNGFKISGTASHVRNGVILYHGTLLICSRLELMPQLLTRKGKVTGGKSTKSTPAKVTNLSDIRPLTITEVMEAFKMQPGIRLYSLSDASDNLTPHITTLISDKYSTDAWNLGFAASFNYTNAIRFFTGTVCINASIDNLYINSISFSGDFFADKPINELEDLLAGQNIDAAKSLLINRGNGYIKGISGADLATLLP